MAVEHSTPPAILIAWSVEDESWIATLIEIAGPIVGPSSTDGRTPMLALDALHEKLLCVGAAAAPTPATVECIVAQPATIGLGL